MIMICNIYVCCDNATYFIYSCHTVNYKEINKICFLDIIVLYLKDNTICIQHTVELHFQDQ